MHSVLYLIVGLMVTFVVPLGLLKLGIWLAEKTNKDK
jgi:hypothetical protein